MLNYPKWLGLFRISLGMVSICIFQTCTPCDMGSSSIRDYIHNTSDGKVFCLADRFKYKRFYSKAGKLFEKSLYQGTLNKEQRVYAYNQLAFINLQLNNKEAAQSWVDSLLRYSPNINQFSKGAYSDYCLNRGVIALRTSKPDLAHKYLDTTIQIHKLIYPKQVHLKKVLAHTYMGLVYYNFEKDIRPFYYHVEKAYTAIIKKPEIWPHCLETEQAMVNLCIWKRNNSGARVHCENVLYLAQSRPDTNFLAMADAICMKGRLDRFLADGDTLKTRQATATIESSIQILIKRRIKSPLCLELYMHLAVSYLSSKNEKSFFRSLKKLENYKKSWPDAADYSEYLLGRYYYQLQKKYPKAIEKFGGFLHKYERNSTINEKILDDTYNALATCFTETSQFDSAYFYMMRYIVHDSKLQDSTIAVERVLQPEIYGLCPYPFWNLQKIGKTFQMQYDSANIKNPELLKMALRAYTISDSLLLVDYPKYDEDMLHNIYYEIGPDLYLGALKALEVLKTSFPQEEAYYTSLAAHFIDRSKNDVLFRFLPANFPPPKLRRLKMALDSLAHKGNLSPEENKRLAFGRFKISNLRTNRTKNLDYAFLKGSTIQAKLKNDEAVLQYKMGEDSTYLLYIDRKSMVLHRISVDSKHIYNAIDVIGKAMVPDSNVSPSTYCITAYRLYKWLIAPVYDSLAKHSKIYIIPDDALNRIPFEALLTKPYSTFNKDTPFLLKADPQLTITYSPSWKILSSHHGGSRNRLAGPAAFFSYGSNKEGLGSSDQEKYVIKQAFGPLEVFEAGRCSKNEFWNAWTEERFQIYCFSLHAGADLEDPLDTKIWFGKGRSDPLYGFEIGKTSVSPSLVVLSACDSGNGKVSTGEGIYSLSRGFFQGGAQSVIAAMWELNDSAANDFLPKFYIKAKRKNPAVALSEAKREYIMELEDECHPRYWAALFYLQ